MIEASQLTFVSAPRISEAIFTKILERAKSPAAAEAAACYAACVTAGLDPAVALAFFKKESTYGTAGVARKTLNWGNLRKGQGNALKTEGGWAWYGTWAAGLADWCLLIKARYVNRGLTTVGLALPIYAPEDDGNKPAEYAKTVAQLVAGWQAQDTPAPVATSGRARVRGNGTRMRNIPTLSGVIVATLKAGHQLTIVAEQKGEEVTQLGQTSNWWSFVRLDNTQVGYIWSPLLERLT